MIHFLIPGKIIDNYLRSGYDEYLKRIKKFTKADIILLKEEKIYDDQIETALLKEGKNALNLIKKDDILILIDIHGKMYDSLAFSKIIETTTQSTNNIFFLFGSSCGLSDIVRKRANYSISLSNLTFTHYHALLLVLEQVYRSFKILSNQTYNK